MGGCLSLLGKLEKICLLEGWQLLGIAWAVQILPAAPPPPAMTSMPKTWKQDYGLEALSFKLMEVL